MKVLIASDAVWHPTGYGTQLKYFMQKLVADGHEVWNYCAGAFMAGYVEYAPGITVIGAGGNDDRWGNHSWNDIADWVNPDVIITWLDCHGMLSYGWTAAPTFMWAPIDTSPISKDERAILSRAVKLMVPSRWGQTVLEEHGFTAEYVPCAIDTDQFDISAEGRKNWRAQMKPEIADDTFLIGMVGLNTGSPDRKGYGYAFDIIKAFVDKHPDEDIRAYIHTDPNGDGLSIPLLGLREAMGLEGVVAFNPPQLPWGRPIHYMSDMYNAFDVYLHTSITEGFGVPVVEAQACGTPVVTNSCTSVTELAMPRYATPYLCDSWVNTHTKVYIPDVEEMTAKLELAYQDWKAGTLSRPAIREHVMKYSLPHVYETYWRPVMAQVPERIDYEAAGAAVGPKVLLGAGQMVKEGFIHHDREMLWPSTEIAFDLTQFPWPVEDNAWGYVEMEDVLEHLKGDINHIFDELWRVMRPGSYLYIHTAEAGSWQLMKDPTHIQGFTPHSFNYYDPSTPEGEHYSYTERKWRIMQRTADAGGLVFVMQPRKTGVEFVEHFGTEVDGETVHVAASCATCLKEQRNGHAETVQEKEVASATR